MATNFSTKNISAIKIAGTQYNVKSVPFHGTEAEWSSSSYIPKQGEIVVYDRDDNCDIERIKIGNGIDLVKDLKFIDDNYYTQSEVDELLSNFQPKNLIVEYTDKQYVYVTHDSDTICDAAEAGIEVKFFDGYEYLNLLEYSKNQHFAVFYTDYYDSNNVLNVKYVVIGGDTIMMAETNQYNVAFKEDLKTKQDKITGFAGQFVKFDSNGKVVGVDFPNVEDISSGLNKGYALYSSPVNGKIITGNITYDELESLEGIKRNVQLQLDDKINASTARSEFATKSELDTKANVKHKHLWDDIADQPFYDKNEVYFEWDGVTEGLKGATIAGFGTLYKVSDELYYKSELIGANADLYIAGQIYPDKIYENTFETSELTSETTWGILLEDYGIFVLQLDQAGVNQLISDGVYGFTPGLWMMSASGNYIAKVYKDGVKQLDEKFIPSTIARISDLEKSNDALQEIEAGVGLKVSAKANNKQTIDIDEDVVFVFNCGSSTFLID